MKEIFPVFDQLMSKQDKEKLLNQNAHVFWLTGLSGSGKTTIAKNLEKKLYQNGFLTQIIDGDNVRSGICNNLSFSLDDRMENIRRISEISKLFINCGIITINCFVSPTIKIRKLAKKIIGTKNFHNIYINASVKECEQRDIKGLYKKARSGEIKDFTGISSPFEVPKNPQLEINTSKLSIQESVNKAFDYIYPLILKK